MINLEQRILNLCRHEHVYVALHFEESFACSPDKEALSGFAEDTYKAKLTKEEVDDAHQRLFKIDAPTERLL